MTRATDASITTSPTELNVFGRYSHRLLNRTENHVIPGPSGGDANGNVRVLNQQIAGGLNYNLSPTSLIDFRFAYSIFEGGKFALGAERPNMLEEYGIPGLPDDPVIGGGLTGQGISGFTSLGRQTSNPQFQNPTTINPKVNYSKILGRHSLKTGYEYQAINTDIFDFNPQYGQDNYWRPVLAADRLQRRTTSTTWRIFCSARARLTA